MVVIRMQRTGRKGHAMYRMVVQDARLTPTSGKVAAQLGHYDPHTKEFVFDQEKVAYYLEHGAQPSPRVARLLKGAGVKLPDWYAAPPEKQSDVRNPAKRRSTTPPAPEEETTPDAPAEVAEAAPDEIASSDQVADETTEPQAAEAPAESDEAPAAESEQPAAGEAPVADTPAESEAQVTGEPDAAAGDTPPEAEDAQK
jgi:small subunit ribosomal protein S16